MGENEPRDEAHVPRRDGRQHARGGRAQGDRGGRRRLGARASAASRRRRSWRCELLNEIAQPGLRDLKVEFRGVKVAAVYPERLPNVAAGTQQILVGRYLPEGQGSAGRSRSSPASAAASRCVTRPRCSSRTPRRATRSFRGCGRGRTWIICSRRARARRCATRSSRCPKSSTSSRRTRRCWCWRPTPTASGSA